MGEEKLDLILSEVGGVNRRLDKIEVRLDGVENGMSKVNNRLDKVENRLDGMDNRFDKIEGRLDGMDSRFDKVDSRLDGVDGRLEQVHMDIRCIKVQLENEISVNIKRVAEGHLDLSRNLKIAQIPSAELEMMSIRLTHLENEVETVKQKIQ